MKKIAIISFMLGFIFASTLAYLVQRKQITNELSNQNSTEQIVPNKDPEVTKDGSFFGQISGISSDDGLNVTFRIYFDSEQWFSVEDGTCSNLYPSLNVPHCPNGAMIKNTEVQMDLLELAGTVSATINKKNDLCEVEGTEVLDGHAFIDSWVETSGCKQSNYHIIMKDGLVTTITEQYFP